MYFSSTLDSNETFLLNENVESEDGAVVERTRANTLTEQAAETTSIFSSSDKRTNVLETDDTKDMIITVEHLPAEMEESVSLEFPLQTPEIDGKNDPSLSIDNTDVSALSE